MTKEPESVEEAARVWQLEKTMATGIVTRVDVFADKHIEVGYDIDFAKALADMPIGDNLA
jgi:hypothetical protein